MNNPFFKFQNFSAISIILIILFVPTFFIPVLYSTSNLDSTNCIFDTSIYAWPIPGYTSLTSPYGKRSSPTAGASSFHKGIDIGAPEGTNLYAICDGTITFLDFLGGGGYTLTLTAANGLKITYCHISPNYLVKVGDTVLKNDLIANVGPKYAYGVPQNTYRDENGIPTNGATTGCHLHLGVRINEEYINPLSLYEDSEEE